jgi:uncharacterized protein
MAKVFLDSNVVMYLIGAPHPNKVMASAVLQRLTAAGDKFVTDAEVFQEILHRYSCINRPDAIQPAFDLLESLTEEIIGIKFSTVKEAKTQLQAYASLSARDAIHIAVMNENGITAIFSFDGDYDQIPNINRISS